MSETDHNKDRVEREIQETLSSLDNIDNVEPEPYFYTRLKSRIEESGRLRDPWVVWTPLGGRLVPAVVAAVFILNVLSAFVVLSDSGDSSTELQQEYYEALAEEYLWSGTSGWLDLVSE